MRTWCGIVCVLVVIYLNNASAQLPPRPLQIPGAVLIQGARPAPHRPQRIGGGGGDFPRPRRPNGFSAPPPPAREIRPVVEEEEELPAPSSNFEDEVNKLGISALTSAVRQAEEEEPIRPSPLPFRPERPIPVTRDQIRERPIDNQPRPQPVARPQPVPRPLPAPSPRPVVRQERPVRQEIDFDEEENIPRQPVRKARPQPPPQQFRPAPAQRPAPRPQYDDDDTPRRKKPVVQILRKYRTDNEDGSITWGFENDDGTFKEETLGIDCITRGKYGYVDPDGVRREYSYESGNKCDEPDQDELEEDLLPRLPPKKPLNTGKPQPQYRPPPGSQY